MLGQAFGECIQMMFIILIISVPLGLWKLIEIIIWLIHHVSIGVH